MCATSAASGKFRQHGRLGGLMTTPVFGSSGPGEQMPTPRIKLCAPAALAAWADAASIALVTDASPREAPSFETMGLRVWHKISPLGSTRPAATLVPPMSTPITRSSRTATEDIPYLSCVWLGRNRRRARRDIHACWWSAGRERPSLHRTTHDAVTALVRCSHTCGISLAVRFRSTQCEEQNVEIANRGRDKCVVNALPPTRFALRHCRVVSAIDKVSCFADQVWNDGTAHDRHVQDAGSVSGERSEFRDPQSENTREHNRVEQAHRQDGPHGHTPVGQNRNANQQSGHNREQRQEFARFDLLQNCRPDKPPNHGAEPVDRYVPGRLSQGCAVAGSWVGDARRESTDIGQGQVVGDGAPYRNFPADVHEDRNRSEYKVRVFPDRVVHLFADVVLGGLDFGELRHAKADRQQEQCHSKEIHIETDNGIGLL